MRNGHKITLWCPIKLGDQSTESLAVLYAYVSMGLVKSMHLIRIDTFRKKMATVIIR